MARTERVTVTLPTELVEGIDRFDRGRFLIEAIEHELVRRRRAGLLRSLANPHPETRALAEAGLAAWGASLPLEDVCLVEAADGTPVRWVEGVGWLEEQA